MLKTRHIAGILGTLFLLSLASEQSLMAYVDPGSGAMFVQIILAGIVGSLFKVRTLVKRFHARKVEKKSNVLQPFGSAGLTRPAK
jgi:hypothetical protein